MIHMRIIMLLQNCVDVRLYVVREVMIMNHYSTRLQRDFRDGDWLTRGEVARVLGENRGRALPADRLVNDFARRRGWHVDRSDKYAPLYRYAEIKDCVIEQRRGRKASSEPSPVALRVRAYRSRQSGIIAKGICQ
jgi:hypothetical protein